MVSAQVTVEECWSNIFNGQDNGSVEDDRADGIAIDSSGNIYVCGSSFEQVSSNLFSPRFVTQKIGLDGKPAWHRFWRPGGNTFAAGADVIAVDSQDNILVAGAAFGSDDWAIIKYDTQGNVLWDHVYEANSTYLTSPSGIFIDSLDNIYITGDVGSSINPDFGAIVKLTPNGIEAWVAEYYGEAFDGAIIEQVIVDDDGNVYAAGLAVVNGFSGQAAFAKFDSQGNFLWERTDGSFFQFAVDQFVQLAFDQAGNIVLLGTFGRNTAKGSDIAIAKYDREGNELWTELWTGTTGSDRGVALRIDGNDQIVIAGVTEVGLNDQDTIIAKYDGSGNLVWDTIIAGKGLGNDGPRQLVVDDQSRIYYTGIEQPFNGVDFQVTGCLDADGVQLWSELYGGPGQCCSSGIDLVVGGDAQIITVGTSFHANDDDNIVTICYQQDSGLLLGDVNLDGSVNLLDVQPFIDLIASAGFQLEADINQDGAVNLLDVAGFVELLSN